MGFGVSDFVSVGHTFVFLSSHYTFFARSGSDFKMPVSASRRVSDLLFSTPIYVISAVITTQSVKFVGPVRLQYNGLASYHSRTTICSYCLLPHSKMRVWMGVPEYQLSARFLPKYQLSVKNLTKYKLSVKIRDYHLTLEGLRGSNWPLPQFLWL